MDSGDELQRGREAYARRAWSEAYEALASADRSEALNADDLELWATAAYMLGRTDDYVAILERAHESLVGLQQPGRAVRCAFWISITLLLRGESGRANGWLGRAQRLLEDDDTDESVERGYLLLPQVFEHEAAGEYEAETEPAAAAAAVGGRSGDRDLFALAVQHQGHLLVSAGEVAQGLGLLDEAMISVTAGELSPIVSGLVYCGVIMGCQEAYEPRRAQEWTTALTRWCEHQPDMGAFPGRCLVHRAEIMQLPGAGPEALDEARRAAERCAEATNETATGEALYREGELHRLLGQLEAAEQAYRRASRCGTEPQPGLALLRVAQGEAEAAAAAVRRLGSEATELPKRAGLLPAQVEILLAVDDVEGATAACEELEQIAAGNAGGMLEALAAYARGTVEFATGDCRSALSAARRASRLWHGLEAPYEAARARVVVGLACRELGDDDAADLELEAARGIFEQLGAAGDLGRVESLIRRGEPRDSHGLTPRELQVLRLVAAGNSNKAIAAELVLSERTIDRHLSNIFAKLGLSSRTAATAFAYENQLL